MQARIQVLSLESKSGRSKKTGNDYSMEVCQCVVYETVDGQQKVQVGELVLPKDHPTVVPGMYDATFGVSVGQDKRIGGRLLSLQPVKVQASAPASSPRSAP